MKKLLVLLALCMVFSVVLVACNNEGTEDTTTDAATDAPTTEAPTTEAPTTETPTEEPTTEAPTTEAPTTEAPTTEEPTTEEPTTEPVDPADPTWSIDAAGLAAAAASGNLVTAEFNEEEGYVRLTATGGDPYFQFLNGAGAQPQFMAIVYRTNTTKQGQIFIGSGAGPNAQGDNPMLTWNGNEQWNILVLDLANTEGLTAVVDGVVNYARLDFFTDQGNEGDYFDIKAVAFYNTAKYATDAFFSTIATIVPAADMAATIPGSPGINGCTLSADGTYVTIDTIGQGDPYYQLPMLNGKGIVAKYAVIKYRSTSTNTVSEAFIGSGAGPAADNNIQFNLTCDGKWNLAIIDLSEHAAVVDGVVNFLRWDPFAGAADATIDLAYIGLFNSEADALAYDATVAGLYVDILNTPMDNWTVSGHAPGLTGTDSPDKGGMITAGGLEKGALLHQGSIGLGELNLAQFSKMIVYYGIDNSQVTIDHWTASANNRIMITNVDTNMTNSPAEENIVASVGYELKGWTLVSVEIDLTGVDYNGPVFVSYDTLPGTFMLVGAIELVYDANYVAPEQPENGSLEMPLTVGQTLNAVAGLEEGAATDIQYYTTGVVTEIGQGGSYYKNVYFTDGENTMLIYTLNPMDGMPELQVGDTITVFGYIKNYQGTIEFASKKMEDDSQVYVFIVAHEPASEEEPAPELPAAPYVDKATAGMIGESCDTITVNDGMYFEDGNAYAKLAAVENKITIKSGDLLGFRGWIGFPQAFDQFGFFINNGDFVGGEYKQATEEVIFTLAGENASRYHVTIDTTGTPAGDYVVTWGAKLADGTLVGFYTVTVTVEAAE